LHTFGPKDLERMATNAGAVQVHTASEEFTAAMFGWPVRTFEATVPPGRLGWNWAKFAFGGWKALSWVDANVWRHVAPKGWFYNVMVTGSTLLSSVSSGLAFSTDDVRYLRSESGAVALAAVADFGLTDATRVADVAAARARFGDRAPVLVETTLLRRRAAAKLEQLCPDFQASNWLFTDEALQQATAAPVARHRARRLAAASLPLVHDATCSIGTELAALRGWGVRALGSDIDPVRLAMARNNLGSTAELCRADALRPVTRDAVVVVDPGRRRGGRRRLRPDDYQPGLAQLLDSYRDRYLVVKCSPE